MVTGQITLNAVVDKAMMEIILAREAHPGLSFSGGQIQPIQIAGNPSKQGFTGIILTWRDADSLRALASLLEKLATIA